MNFPKVKDAGGAAPKGKSPEGRRTIGGKSSEMTPNRVIGADKGGNKNMTPRNLAGITTVKRNTFTVKGSGNMNGFPKSKGE